MKRELERIEIPGEHGGARAAWRVVESGVRRATAAPSARAGLAWRPSRSRSPWLVAAALSPPGQAVLDEIREVVGVERAQPALFSLPAPGRLLVASDAGVWVVQQDGSNRLLGAYREASWSPFGRFVVVAGENELAALEPDGDVRWTLARRVSLPALGGLRDRHADRLRRPHRVVAGDGTGDEPLCAVSARRAGAGLATGRAARNRPHRPERCRVRRGSRRMPQALDIESDSGTTARSGPRTEPGCW